MIDFEKHRSIRKYKKKAVPIETVHRILQRAITGASSSGNMQTYSILITTDLALRKELHALHFHQDGVLEAPAFLTFCADFHRMRLWTQQSEAPDNFDNFMSFMIGAIDAILVAQNTALAAEEEGLGICYLGTTLANCAKIGKLLELPPNVVPVVGFTLGYPNEKPPARDRLPLNSLIHYERYQDFDTDRIRETYKARESLGMERYLSLPKLREKVLAAGAENLAQIYTKVKYTRASHLEYSRTVLEYLEAQNFMNHSLAKPPR